MFILWRKLKVLVFNKRNKTRISSCRASLDATYGLGVLIGEHTYVDHNVVIGNYSYINSNSSAENCVIGKYCSISSGVYINPAEHNIKSRSNYPLFENKSQDHTVIIGNDVLISLNCIILSGVTIGDGAVIGAGAVVTKNIEPYEIVGGVPAKHIGWRKNIPPKINGVEWWEYDLDVVRKNKDFFLMKTDTFVSDAGDHYEFTFNTNKR